MKRTATKPKTTLPGSRGKKPKSPTNGVNRTAKRAVDATEQAALAASQAAVDKKATEPVLLDVKGHASYADYILILSGQNERHVGAISDAVEDRLAKEGQKPLSREGKSGWRLLDYGDIVVHIFTAPVRGFYDLEGLWIEAPRVEMGPVR